MRIGLLLTFFVLGCSSLDVPNDGHLRVYAESFVTKSNGKVKTKDIDKFSLYFKTQKKNVIGTCRYIHKTVEIDPTFFYTSTYRRRIELVFHELAHCVCDRRHTKKLLKDKCPDSLMFAKTIKSECLDKHWDYYMKEVYEGC